jgi:hypothetical protein
MGVDPVAALQRDFEADYFREAVSVIENPWRFNRAFSSTGPLADFRSALTARGWRRLGKGSRLRGLFAASPQCGSRSIRRRFRKVVDNDYVGGRLDGFQFQSELFFESGSIVRQRIRDWIWAGNRKTVDGEGDIE